MDQKLAWKLMELSRDIQLISPLPLISQDGCRKLAAIRIRQNPVRTEDGKLAAYVFPDKDALCYEDHVLLRKVLMENLDDSRQMLGLYEALKAMVLEKVSLKRLMRISGFRDFYKVRQTFERCISSGLIIPVPHEDDSGRHLYFPYFYQGNDEEVLMLRHLLSLGYEISYEENRIRLYYLRRLGELVACAYGSIEEMLALESQKKAERRLLVSPRTHVTHFLDIQNLTLRELSGSICLFP